MMIITYLLVTDRPSCGQEVIFMVAEYDTFSKRCFVAIHDSCGRSCNAAMNPFMTMDNISVMCCNSCYVT